MPTLSGALRRSLTGALLAGSSTVTRRMLRGRSGERCFSRVMIVAALGRTNGIVRGAHLQLAALRSLGVQADLLDATAGLRNPLARLPHQPGTAYVFHSAGPQTASLINTVLPHAAEAYRVGYWAWELPDPPPDWAGCERNLDEIWTPSRFARDGLAKLVGCPIEVVPHWLPARPRRSDRVGGPFTFLAMADSRSSWARKNPEGAVRAFRAAFGTSANVRLVLKLGGREADQRLLEASLAGMIASDNISVVRGHLSDAALDDLFRVSDVLLSLHRAEGYGLPMAEAMAHGIPVVATGWSGNLEFMGHDESVLVPCKLIPVKDESGIYRGSVWAEPDIDAAAVALRRLADDPAYYARMADAAYRRAAEARPRFPFALPHDRASDMGASDMGASDIGASDIGAAA